MRFSTIFLSSVVAALSVQAQANNGTATTESPAVSGTSKPTPGQQAAAVCLEACPSNDNECRAECQLLANSVNPIGDCQTACPKGDGKAAANLTYKECILGCNSIVATPTTAEETSGSGATAAPSGTGSGTGTGTGTDSGDDSGDDATESGSGSDVKASGTGTDAAPSATAPGAAANVAVSVSIGAGLGLFAMMFAL
ncbi:hypothetical protein V496_10121 [Pseudogymnoascus sp. VKM F-4515 (FW-2607)]|nr:hypothetical protein V496_10121 [Pseudogymnoascus sp. VKM F-4515 (FW-2607)]KFY84313.1 hypothetical protein V498_07842 [Pseudogymnoascus sp. VKM F-4517 (FW-2822)]